MTYQFSHFNKHTTASLGENDITVLINHKGQETVRKLAYSTIRKIHLSARDVNHFRCNVFFEEDNYKLSLGNMNMNLGLSRPNKEQWTAYNSFIKTLHQKVMATDSLKQQVKFVCGNSAKMWLYIAIIVVFMTVSVPMAISLKRYELLLLPLGGLSVLLFFMRANGFARPYYPTDNNAIAKFLPDTAV